MEIIKPRTLSGFMELLPGKQIRFEKMVEILRNTYAFYRKWLRDVALDQQKTGGGVPHMVPRKVKIATAI